MGRDGFMNGGNRVPDTDDKLLRLMLGVSLRGVNLVWKLGGRGSWFDSLLKDMRSSLKRDGGISTSMERTDG